MKVIILKGLPGSGKSTYAKNLIDKNPGKYKRINKDSLREMLDGGKWSKANEKFVESVRDLLITQALGAGYHVIVDDTNFAPQHEKRIRQLVKGKAEISVEFFDVDVEKCIKRDLARPVSVGEKVIRDMYKQYLAPKEAYEHVLGLPFVIICDLDGTLAQIGDRSPYAADECMKDELSYEVYESIKGLRMAGYELILMSGRQELHRPQTEEWLSKHNIIYDGLFMRPTGDQRKDSIVKRELFETHIRGKYNVFVIFDDRVQVVEMWRSLGLKCFQVNDGDF